MSTFKKCQVVMLPTNEKAKNRLWTNKDDKLCYNIYPYGTLKQSFHLYILSDEKIKDGETNFYVYDSLNNKILFISYIDYRIDNSERFAFITEEGTASGTTHKKVIATTDGSLSEINQCDGCLKGLPLDNHGHHIDKQMFGIGCTKDRYKQLPQPSQSFIEKYVEEYNKGNVITEVMVEYEEIHYAPHIKDLDKSSYFDLKINPKDNTITIRKTKDSWSREEVKNLCFKAFLNHKLTSDKKWQQEDIENALDPFNKWIEENL